ncbi:hypothetical protein ABO04_06220 [Nitrosomonas sp. HPC101]|nr:hypothetical protein [Nitrosomonas sp. HPC101]
MREIQSKLTARIFLIGFIFLTTLSHAGGTHNDPTSCSKATLKLPAKQCFNLDAENLQALQQDHKRVVIVVQSFKPLRLPAGLVVWLVVDNQRHELTRFAIHPLRAFTMQEPERQSRFLVSLVEQASLIKAGKPLCLEVGFDGSQGSGEAEIMIELINTPK